MMNTPHQKPQSATNRTYLKLHEAIIVGHYTPGHQLKISALSSELGTGTTPVREALSLLVSDQLVERIDQRGFWVAKASRQHFQEVLKLRCQLEALALRDSIDMATREQDRQVIQSLFVYENQTGNDPQSRRQAHKSFHMALLKGCGSSILLRMCGQLHDLNTRYRYLARQSDSYPNRNPGAEHHAILAAFLERDSARACNALTQHYQTTRIFLPDPFI